MSEYAPAAIEGIWETVHKVMPDVHNVGIIGNGAHTYGYHRSRNRLIANGQRSDYSIQSPLDHKGDSDAASALDLGPEGAQRQRQLSALLLKRCQEKDARLKPLREFFGSTDSKRTMGYSPYRGRAVQTGDKSHLTHVHLSIFRAYANDHDCLQALAELITGVTWEQSLYNPAHTQPTPTPTPLPQVSLAALMAAFVADPARPQGGTTPGSADDVQLVEQALVRKGLLDDDYATDGSAGSLTVAAYRIWQRLCGYEGVDANGIPGKTSLVKLGKFAGFTVTK